jgi:hypothetical protein
MNSRTSRPRSPIIATTTRSASEWRVAMPSRLDLPTPEPANKPTRMPRASVVMPLMARTPMSKGSAMRARVIGLTDMPASGQRPVSPIGPSSSSGSP